jgi:hypothetical protein
MAPQTSTVTGISLVMLDAALQNGAKRHMDRYLKRKAAASLQ